MVKKEKITYASDGFITKNNTQAYGEELDNIKQKNGKLTAKLVIKEAKCKNNVLHDYFDWDNE